MITLSEPEVDTHAQCWHYADGWYLLYRVWPDKKNLRNYTSEVFGPTSSLFDLAALLNFRRLAPEFNWCSGGNAGPGVLLQRGGSLKPVALTVLSPIHYGLEGVPDHFIPSPIGRTLFLYDCRTGVLFRFQKGRLTFSPGYYWKDRGVELFTRSCPPPTTATEWESLALREARHELSLGAVYEPVIIPGLDRQPWTREQILKAK